jgi:hypothetical protein
VSPTTPIRASGGGGLGLTGPVPRDIWLLLGIVFGTFSLQFFAASAWLPAALRLTPDIWRHGFLWQAVSFPFVGSGAPGFWFVLELLILLMFGRDVYYRLGRRGFWSLLVKAALVSAAVAVAVALVQTVLGGAASPSRFALMQGQHFVITVLIAAFATLNANATILLFFVLPIQARWFLLLEIVFAFMGFLGTGDLAGFLGLCTAVGAGVLLVGGRLTGGPWREIGLRARQVWLRARLAWLKRRRGLRVVRNEDDRGPDRWVH